MRWTRACAVAWAVFLGPVQAFAHSWYDPYCCNGRDCQPIPTQSVKVTPKGYLVILRPGEHTMVKRTVRHLVPFAKVKPSADRRYHACLFPNQDHIRCFYAPPVGF